jgi:hypothetical protein
MKCADIGHLTHKWETHVKWVELLEEEMWRQGDAEKARNMSVSPLMDRYAWYVWLSRWWER